MGISMRSCTVRPGIASSCSRLHATPTGMNRFAGGSTPSASSFEPRRHSSASVFSRAPPQVVHGV